MKKCFFVCAAVIAAVACTREPVTPEQPETFKNGPIPVTLVVGEPGTRTELTEENGEIHPLWSRGDGISVITYPGGGVGEFGVFDFSSDLESAASTASFSGLPDEPGRFFAVYPQRKAVYNSYWNEYENNPEFYDDGFADGMVEFSFTLPSVQHPSLTSFDPDADLLISDPFDLSYEDYDEELDRVIVNGVSFTRVNAIVKIVLNPQTSRLKGQTVRKVTIGTDAFTSGGDGPGPLSVAARPTRADIFDSDEEDYSADHGLGGRMYFELYSDDDDVKYINGSESVTAEYTDETYQIGDQGAATYLVTFPGILMNGESYDEETGSSVFDDGLHIRVETDELIIDRNVVLPPNGIALQPSRVTTLNIKLYDDGVQGTTIQTIGMTLSEESVSLKPGKGMQLAAQFIGINPDSDELEDLVWTSSDNNVVVVEPVCYFYGGELRSGNTAYTNLATITAVSEGSATITATYQGKYVATCNVTVAIVPEQPSQMVDLGLPSGTKWAQWNLGAQSWDQEGDLYAWGETGYKSEFSWDNYALASGYHRLNKYTMSAVYSSNHQIDNTFLLDYPDDAASVNWGSAWYTPTTEQWNELKGECSWDYIYDDDDNLIGYTATGPNGNSISFSSVGSNGNTLTYLSSVLPLPSSGDVSSALKFYSIPVYVDTYWSSEQGSHNVCPSNVMYNNDRGEDAAYVRPVSGGLEMRKEPYIGAITLESDGIRVRAQFPAYESEREKSFRENPDYVDYTVTAVILYSTDSDAEPGKYSHSHMYGETGTSSNAKYVRFNIEDIQDNKVCSFIPEGVSGTVYFRAYYYSTVKDYVGQSTNTIVNEYHGVTRCITAQ